MKLTEEQVERLISIVRSHHVRLRLSGDYPERAKDEAILNALIDEKWQRQRGGGRQDDEYPIRPTDER